MHRREEWYACSRRASGKTAVCFLLSALSSCIIVQPDTGRLDWQGTWEALVPQGPGAGADEATLYTLDLSRRGRRLTGTLSVRVVEDGPPEDASDRIVREETVYALTADVEDGVAQGAVQLEDNPPWPVTLRLEGDTIRLEVSIWSFIPPPLERV